MTFLVAAAGTGGHVYPGLAVGEALIELGVSRRDVLFVGGSRLETRVYPEEGFPFLEVELRGLKRSMTVANLRIPATVWKARGQIREAIVSFRVAVALGMGGYATIPAALAARAAEVPFMNSEQNREAGLANRVASRWAVRSFGSFPHTIGMPGAEWVGNPVREPFWSFDRTELRPIGLGRYGLDDGVPTLGVTGGSLGAGVLNEAVSGLARRGVGRPLQIVHLTGEQHLPSLRDAEADDRVRWVRLGYEEEMELFYAVSDMVLARAGGAVAELTATKTPALLVPGDFGSSGHQSGNAEFLANAGAAMTLDQEALAHVDDLVEELLFDRSRLGAMREAAERIAKPDAALTIARAMLEAA